MFQSNVEIAFLALVVGAIIAGIPRSWRTAGWLAAIFVGAAAVLCWLDAVDVLAGGKTLHSLVLNIPFFAASLAVDLDPLGAGFLILMITVTFLAAIYSIGYMSEEKTEKPFRFYTPLLLFAAGMVGVVSVQDWLMFFVFWELMTLASYLLVVFKKEDPIVQRASLKYFIMTHVASVGLLVAAIVLWHKTGSFSFGDQAAALKNSTLLLRNTLLALYFLAFATKAGIFPLGDWLPDAHPAAPSGVSAILSGAMIKLGAYGILRVFWQLMSDGLTRTELLTWGVIIAAFGTVSAFVGGVTAMRENDFKRQLAFSSIGQTGYIFLALGIGIALLKSHRFEPIALLAMLGAGFHMLNDAVYKSLLFMNAGSVLYSTGTSDLRKVGGLFAVMPGVAIAAFVGVLSLSGLPPTNGFASKWVIYQSAVSAGLVFSPFLVMAVIAFFASLSTFAYSLKFFYGSAFLEPPSEEYEPRRLPLTMSFSQVLLAVICIAIGLVPVLAVDSVASVFQMPRHALYRVGAFGELATNPVAHPLSAVWNPVGLALALIVCFALAEWVRGLGKAKVRAVPNWHCGEEHPEKEVRFRAQDFYAPFNEIFAKVYP
ncbi:MAG: proton-conducting transporter membrane subunit, partial [Armatimonadota bacterium]|nr:proton-conducting transporter membrane subunit [Armatimonadota bacterium]